MQVTGLQHQKIHDRDRSLGSLLDRRPTLPLGTRIGLLGLGGEPWAAVRDESAVRAVLCPDDHVLSVPPRDGHDHHVGHSTAALRRAADDLPLPQTPEHTHECRVEDLIRVGVKLQVLPGDLVPVELLHCPTFRPQSPKVARATLPLCGHSHFALVWSTVMSIETDIGRLM